MELVFEWDPSKDRTNRKKHGVSFTEAVSVFRDPLAQIFSDEGHSVDEQREILVGHSQQKRLLIVCFVERTRERVRIISARRATKREQHGYEEHIKP